jgi:hypothetical protein
MNVTFDSEAIAIVDAPPVASGSTRYSTLANSVYDMRPLRFYCLPTLINRHHRYGDGIYVFIRYQSHQIERG